MTEPKISLCVIAGNEQAVILDCLESAQDAFDELCTVRAIGDQRPDDTLKLARAWALDHGKEFQFGEYRNTIPYAHVDNFALARNMSFDLATGDWLLWLDCDDHLDEINSRRIREAVRVVPEDVNAIFCVYKIEKDGGEILRERLIRRGKGTWKNPVHEVCSISGKAMNCPQITVYHRQNDPEHRVASAKRNARIMGRILEDTPRGLFHLSADLKDCGDTARALTAGLAAWELLGAGQTEERYPLALNLSELQPQAAEHWLMNAVMVAPHRREAFGRLCQLALVEGRLSDSVSWFRIMDSLPPPKPLPWTHNDFWYGAGRHALRYQVMLACGQQKEAEEFHALHLADEAYAALFQEK